MFGFITLGLLLQELLVLCWNSVSRIFLCRLFRYWIEIWYLNIFWLNTDQFLLLPSLTFLYMSYCPLLKFSFPAFSMQSFEILTLNRWSSSWSVFIGVMPPKYLLGPVGDMYCLSNTFRMLVYSEIFYFRWIQRPSDRVFIRRSRQN